MPSAEYMRNQRKKISIESNGNLLQINGNELLNLIKLFCLNFTENEIESLLKNNNGDKIALKINIEKGELLKNNNGENSENGSKTQFSGKNSASWEGGGLGVGGCTSSTSQYLYINQSNSKEKEIFSQKPIKKKMTFEEWKELEKAARPYWCVMYKECRDKSTFKKFVFAFNKIKKDIPNLTTFYATLKIKGSVWSEGFYTAAHNFLANETWRDFSQMEIQKLNENWKTYEKQAKWFVENFDKKVDTNNV
jgi:hypothetical protein